MPRPAPLRPRAGLLLALWAALALACAPAPEPQGKRKPGGAQTHLVESVPVRRERRAVVHVRTGSLKARRTVRIFNQEEGRITSLALFEGDPVAEGQLLVQLDDRLLRAQLDKAAATRRKAAADLARTRKLIDKRLASRDQLSQDETAVQVARAEETVLSTRVSYTTIKAPFAGVVSARRVEPGDVVARHTHLMSLSDPSSLVTRLAVSELLLPQLRVGDPVRVRIDALGERAHPGHILRIHPELDSSTRRGTLEVTLDPVPEGARAGQFCRVTLRTAELPRKLVPFRALRRDRRGELVYRLGDDGKARRVAVRSGLRLDQDVEILAGLEEGQQVVVKGFLGLRDGLAVQAVDSAAPLAGAAPGPARPDRAGATP